MSIGPYAQWFAFTVFTLISVAGALGMATTMSMFRSGIFLMGSFIGVAGLFILLSADLLALLQIMMYIGGMLVMILFMVLFAHDPGGSMMAGMEMSLIERFFSLGIKPQKMEMDHGNSGENHSHSNHADQDSKQKNDQQDHSAGEQENGNSHSPGEQQEHSGHSGMDMSMTTPVKRVAAVLGLLMGMLLMLLLLFRPAWKLSGETPDPDSAERVGQLLMGKYMMAFEGAGLLILIGIFGAVLLARAGKFPDKSGRTAPVAVDEQPPPLSEKEFSPTQKEKTPPSLRIIDIHIDKKEDTSA
ncbi:MAG: NADH-quinone oxidoreductase subunit J [Calditrichia bacterium]